MSRKVDPRARAFARWMFDKAARDSYRRWSSLPTRGQRRWIELAETLILTGLDVESLMEHL